jgi:hypothetical protein
LQEQSGSLETVLDIGWKFDPARAWRPVLVNQGEVLPTTRVKEIATVKHIAADERLVAEAR